MRFSAVSLALLCALPQLAGAQTAPASLFFEDLTFNEIRDLVAGGYKTIVVPTGGTEDKGPHMAMGEHNVVVAYSAEQIAKRLGGTLVAPVIAYVPEGNFQPVSGHLRYAGSISLPDDQGYTTLLEAAATSFKGAGFKTVIFIGDSGGNQAGQKAVADKLTAAWQRDGVKVLAIPDYYAKSHDDQNQWITTNLHIPLDEIGGHANIMDTSELMFVNPGKVRFDRLELGNQTNAITGDARPATPTLGEVFIRIKIENALAQIRQLMGMPAQKASTTPLVAPLPPMTPIAAQAQATPVPGSRFPSYFIEDLTFMEVRDAIASGHTIGIIPTGGTEKNGYHVTTGKHNFHVRSGASRLAAKLGNALIAPVIQYVPEGPATLDNPAVISCRDACFENIVTAGARSLKAGGFKDILLIGDNGGNQASLTKVAEALNKEWAGTDVKVFALTDYYDKGREHFEAYLGAVYGWNAEQVGVHGGIQDTSQMEWVKPYDVRMDQIARSEADRTGASITGDPSKATPEFGRITIELKANSALAQYRQMKTPPAQRTNGG